MWHMQASTLGYIGSSTNQQFMCSPPYPRDSLWHLHFWMLIHMVLLGIETVFSAPPLIGPSHPLFQESAIHYLPCKQFCGTTHECDVDIDLNHILSTIHLAPPMKFLHHIIPLFTLYPAALGSVSILFPAFACGPLRGVHFTCP